MAGFTPEAARQGARAAAARHREQCRQADAVVAPVALELRRQGLSLSQIGDELARRGFRTRRGGTKWDKKQVQRILERAGAGAPERTELTPPATDSVTPPAAKEGSRKKEVMAGWQEPAFFGGEVARTPSVTEPAENPFPSATKLHKDDAPFSPGRFVSAGDGPGLFQAPVFVGSEDVTLPAETTEPVTDCGSPPPLMDTPAPSADEPAATDPDASPPEGPPLADMFQSRVQVLSDRHQTGTERAAPWATRERTNCLFYGRSSGDGASRTQRRCSRPDESNRMNVGVSPTPTRSAYRRLTSATVFR